MTLLETIVLVSVVAFLMLLLLPTLMSSHGHGRHRIFCVNNLKQVGLAYRIWSDDNHGFYPQEVSVTNGGTKELNLNEDIWKTFQVMSNELSTPKILLCPEDSAHRIFATNFGPDLKGKISYFIGLDVSTNLPQAFLSGDDTFSVNGQMVKGGLLNLQTNSTVAWSAARHHFTGNICFGDGSVESVSNAGLTNLLQQTGLVTNHLAIP